MLSFLNPFLRFPSVSLSSLPSSTSSLKVRSASSFLTTELPRGCGRCASSITPSSGKNRSGVVVGGLLFRFSVGKKRLIRFTTSLGAVRSCINIYETYIKPSDPRMTLSSFASLLPCRYTAERSVPSLTAVSVFSGWCPRSLLRRASW